MDQDRYRRLCNLCVEQRRTVVFEWIKTGVITLQDFDLICDELLLGS